MKNPNMFVVCSQMREFIADVESRAEKAINSNPEKSFDEVLTRSLISAINCRYGWSIEFPLEFAGKLLEDVNCHSEASVCFKSLNK